ncbi:single-stranded-DNA-specific exonuclease RecJ [Fructilactobacillus carniphilus]|uniref:Single-stranded-DNA-specific exonuclease RecJ n=1 Tax=Fructilactobacillus carniphilus TaxID=2940297 RepID=A0ABY5C032_9LACO|nr:single-stranded-DNA-specific exonuclease RecJ [Fructilactobacillus carniphilus]USS90948.1 single-stranded-DNA-specific exonuclease RecJ [Fructilactobacillus carniphilus]
MFSAKFKWTDKPQTATTELVESLSSELGLPQLTTQILVNRGYTDPDQIKHFLAPDESDLLDPMLLHDMETAVERIQAAIANEEQITVYGDYDADGLTSTAILYETLLEIGANVNYYIPNRFSDGYGPNVAAFEKLIENGTSLIVTVDNGVAGNEAIARAQELKCDVVVTDHHELPEQLPNATAIVHADLSPDYPFKELSGAGIAFKVATALTDEIPQEKLDLASIGTIADLVSLTGENRALVQFGLNVIHLTERPGLKALIKKAKLKLDQVDEENISFQIAPALNSIGRMGEATPGIQLLTTDDEALALKLAQQTLKTNDQRKQLVTEITEQAELLVAKQADQPVLVLVGADWHEGVLGIVASRIKEKFQKPTIVLTKTKNGLVKGSGRSVPGFDLFQALNPERDLMTAFGGHEMAVGLTLASDQLPEFQRRLEETAQKQGLQKNQRAELAIDYSIQPDDVNQTLYDNLQLLSPFGVDNEKPEFAIHPNSLSGLLAIGADKSHLKFELVGNRQKVGAIAFGWGTKLSQLQKLVANLKVAGTIGKNEFRGRTNFQIMVDDIAPAGVVLEDRRTNQLVQSMFQKPGTYLFFNEKRQQQLAPYLNEQSEGLLVKNVDFQQQQFDHLFIVDFPARLADLQQVVRLAKTPVITLYLYKKQRLRMVGMPDREQYTKLFKFLEKQPTVALRNHIPKLGQQLHLDPQALVFMIQVFTELGFVTVNDGVLHKVDNPPHRALNTATCYQQRELDLQLEQQLLASSQQKFLQWLQSLRTQD